MTSEVSDRLLKEWSKARNTLSAFDDRLDALRKYGFGLVTALITADAFLLPGTVSSTSALPDRVKFSVLGATLLLLAAVEILDRNYRVVQQAVASRAVVIEAALNMELTDDIGRRYDEAGLGGASLMYALVGFSVLVLGFFVLDSWLYQGLLILGVALWLVLSTVFIRPNLTHHGGVDWTVDRSEIRSVYSGKTFRLTVTNILPKTPGTDTWKIPTASSGAGAAEAPSRPEAHGWKERIFAWWWLLTVYEGHNPAVNWEEGEVLWRIEEEGCPLGVGPSDPRVVRSEQTVARLSLDPQENHLWQIPVSILPGPGVYQIRPTKFFQGKCQLWDHPLPTKIVVLGGDSVTPPGA